MGGGRVPGFEVGPAYIDPNGARVARELVSVCEAGIDDPLVDEVVAYFDVRHPGTRAFAWEDS